jgi:hypothetical protein
MTLPGDKTPLGRNDLLYAMFNSTGIEADKLSIKYLRPQVPLPLKGATAYYNDKIGRRLVGRPCSLGWQLRVIGRCRG